MFSRLPSALQLEASGILHALGLSELIGVADKLARETQADFDMIMMAFLSHVSSCVSIDAVAVFSVRGMPEFSNIAIKLSKLPRPDFDAVMHAFRCYRRSYELDAERCVRHVRPERRSVRAA